MSDTKTIDQSQSGQRRPYVRLTPEGAVLLLIDHQAGSFRAFEISRPTRCATMPSRSPAPRASSASRSC